jgi:hypothetical protein
VKHKITVYSCEGGHDETGRWWYAHCKCGWAHETKHVWPNGRTRWARPTWDAAFALGVAHQKNTIERCRCAKS